MSSEIYIYIIYEYLALLLTLFSNFNRVKVVIIKLIIFQGDGGQIATFIFFNNVIN